MRRIRPGSPRERLIVALDYPDLGAAEAMVRRLADSVAFYKIGLELVLGGGLPLAERLAAEGRSVFLDFKLLDIDNTVARAVESIVRLGVRFATVHAYPQAMRAAVMARGKDSVGLLGVTVLTSMDQAQFAAAGYAGTIADRVVARAKDAKAAGMDGVVASADEAAAVRRAIGPDLAIVTPGIRPAGGERGDQRRVATPGSAIAAGADYLVVGRPITAAADPKGAAAAIVDEIEAALAGSPHG